LRLNTRLISLQWERLHITDLHLDFDQTWINVILIEINLNVLISKMYNEVRFMRCMVWARGSLVVEALCYKLEGRGFDSLSGH
jgi:hypothetical protein